MKAGGHVNDCLDALQATIPRLTRPSLHRCLQRHGISRLPSIEGDAPVRAKFKSYPIGYFHIDITEVRTEQGKLYLFVAIDRTSKFAFVELHEKATRRVAGDFLRALAAAVPYKVHTVLTDNGTHFTDPTGDGWTPEDIKGHRQVKLRGFAVPDRRAIAGVCRPLEIRFTRVTAILPRSSATRSGSTSGFH
jgi:transposase InsO family protein